MQSDTIGIITGIAIVLMVYSSVFWIGESSNQRAIEKLAIENGCGQYNPQSGKFEWLQVNK